MLSGTLSVEALLERIIGETRAQITQREIDAPLMIGIRTGGAWIAERLHNALELETPLGVLDISFYM